MLFFLARLLTRVLFLRTWAAPLAVILFVFLTSWPLMTLAEADGSELVTAGNYWWYFVVTASTVGYGDFSPETGLGHLVGGYVIVGGIATLTTVFAKLAEGLERAKGQRMQGTNTVDGAGHVVLLGYTPGRTERIVGQLRADGVRRLVLCAWDETGTHPMPAEDVDFVRGELTDEGVLRRAAVHRASALLVDARDDNEALAVAVTVNHVNPGTHLVVTLRDMERASLLSYIDARVRCVQWHTPRMITEELVSPGIAEMYTALMANQGAGTYSVTLPDTGRPMLVEDCQLALGRRFGATLLAARVRGELRVNPDWRSELPAGTVLYYVSPHRLTAEQVAGVFTAQG